MHIHPSSPSSDLSLQSEESAATKIQAGFRSYRVRKQLKFSKENYNSSHSILKRRQKQNMSHTQRCVDAEMTSASTKICDERALNRSETVEDRCATKIQASVRGFLVRKKQQKSAEAATKIQVGFRSFKARKDSQIPKEN